MSCSSWDKYMSKQAIPRVEDVNDPVLDVARGQGDDTWGRRWDFVSRAEKGFSNFDFSKDKFSLSEE